MKPPQKNKYDPKTETVKYLELIDQNKFRLIFNTASKVCRFTGHASTVWLKWIAHFAVGVHLLHQYKSSLAHLSDFNSLVIGLLKYKI